MSKSSSNSAKYTFLYLLSLFSLISVTLSIGNIIFQLINKHVVDIIHTYSGNYSSSAVKFAISSLIIATPIYYLCVGQINKNLSTGELSRTSQIRRWLTYFILLVSSFVAIGWLIAIIYSFLDGDLTLKFGLKTLASLSIAGIVGGYYFYDIKRSKIDDKNEIIKYYFYSTLAIIVITFFAGLFFVESPKETRQRKLDNLILEKFSKIDGALNNYYIDKEKLPKTLEELASDVTYLVDDDIRYVENNNIIEYKVIEDKKYSLCANFYFSNINVKDRDYDYFGEFWPHNAGNECLTKNVVDNDFKGMPMRVY